MTKREAAVCIFVPGLIIGIGLSCGTESHPNVGPPGPPGPHVCLTLCHKGRTITVSPAAVVNHLVQHGDYCGPCKTD